MSIIQQHTSASLSDAWRTINIDALTEDSSVNFDTSTLCPPQPEVSESDVRQISAQVRQLSRGGDAEGALRSCLESPVYNGTDAAKVNRTAGGIPWAVGEQRGWIRGTSADGDCNANRKRIFRPLLKFCSRSRRAK